MCSATKGKETGFPADIRSGRATPVETRSWLRPFAFEVKRRTSRHETTGHGANSADVVEFSDGFNQFRTGDRPFRSEEHTSELQSRQYLVCRLLLEKNKTSETTGACAPFETDDTGPAGRRRGD